MPPSRHGEAPPLLGDEADAGCALFPLNSLVYGAKPSTLRGIDQLHESHAAIEVRAKLVMALTVLRGWTQPNAVRKRGLETVEVSSYDI